jgi:5'-3' exonuclease
MGIKSLNNLLKRYENIHEEIHISEYAYRKVAVDTSLFVYKYKFVQGENWMASFVQLISVLRKNKIHCVFIFDSPAPDDKKIEQQKRRDNREKDKQKIFELDDAMNTFHCTGEIGKPLIDLDEKLKTKGEAQRLLRPGINIQAVQNYIEKMKTRTIDIEAKDFELAKELFKHLGVPYFMAPEEAETMCAHLCKCGLVDAVLTEDTDVLAYGTPVFLSKINTSTETCVRVNFPTLLEELDMNYEQFLDVCIMCGTDYNNNIEGIGVIKAFEVIKEHGSIEQFIQHINYLHDKGLKMKKFEERALDKTDVLNHIRVRQLFTEYKKADISVKHCHQPYWEDLSVFLVTHNYKIDINALKYCFAPPKIVFLEDNQEIEGDDIKDDIKDVFE